MITPKNEALMTKAQYENYAADFIGLVEGEVPFIYKDSAGLPTIGIGHLIDIAGKTKQQVEYELSQAIGRTVTFASQGWDNFTSFPTSTLGMHTSGNE